MTKENISATVDPEVAAYLSQEHINISATVNKAIKAHMAGGDNDAVQEFLMRQTEEEIGELQTRLERKEEFLQTLEEVSDEQEAEEEAKLQDALDKIEDAPRDPENPAVKHQAQKVGLKPKELLAELRERNQ